MPHSDTGSPTGVTAAALARIDWSGEAASILRPSIAFTIPARDMVLLANIAAAAVRLVAFGTARNGDWPWWGWTGEDGAGCLGCLADDDDLG